MEFNYLFWGAFKLDNVATLEQVKNVSKTYQIKKGVPRAVGFPDDAYARMSDDLPNDTLLADVLTNINTFVLVSRREREFIAARVTDEVEFLEIRVQNHKGREIDERYYIVHPIGIVDIVDRDASGVRIDEYGNIERLEKFVVIPANIPDKPIFRVAGLGTYIVIQRELAAALEQAGFTGNRFVEASKIVGIDLPPGIESLPYY
jgi:hypothetical protein